MTYSSPSKYGALIAGTILNNPQYFAEWEKELKEVVVKRIMEVRALLRAELEKIGTPGSWQHITDQIGMFSYTGLSERTCELLSSKYHVYLLKSGRISMAGINKRNVKYLAQAIKNALLETQ
jgi:aspartate aminotransferase